MPEAVANELRQTPDEAWPNFGEDEIRAVTDVLRSGKVNQWTGSLIKEFQQAFTRWIGAPFGIALTNGSVALELPLRAFGIGPGDEVIVTPRTFMDSASCVRLVGATPVFADIDPVSGNITPDTIAQVISPRTKAVIPVHLGGWPCDMPGIMAIAEKHGLKVIEDCAQSHGAMIGDRMAGSFGHAAAFSFCQDKIMTTGGEGGFTVFQDEAAWEWSWSFKDHGKNWKTVNTPPEKPGFRWLHDSIGTNWRMTEMQAAIGLAQLSKMDEWTKLRTRNAHVWQDAVAGVAGLGAPVPGSGITHAFYKFYMYLDAGMNNVEAVRDDILEACAAGGVKVLSGSCSEVYLEKAFADLPQQRLEHAHQLSQTSLMVEVHPTLDHGRLISRANWFKQLLEGRISGG